LKLHIEEAYRQEEKEAYWYTLSKIASLTGKNYRPHKCVCVYCALKGKERAPSDNGIQVK
jgi:hypothetical protein